MKFHRSSKSRAFRSLGQIATKIFICLTAIAIFIFLVWSGYYLFLQKENPVWGTSPAWKASTFLVGLVAFIINIRILRSHRYKRVTPSFKLVALCLLILVVVLAFAGVEPLRHYKDDLFSFSEEKTEQVKDAYANWQAEREQAAEKKLAEQEKEVHNLINSERTKIGLTPVSWSQEMYALAKDQSNKMANEDRLFHSNRYALQGGENCWGGEGHNWTPKDIVDSWMGSPPHRAWILDPRVRTAGVGITHSERGMYAAWAFSD